MGTETRNEMEEFPPLNSNSSSSKAKDGLTVTENGIISSSNSSLVVGKKGENANPNPNNWRTLFPSPRVIIPQPNMRFTAPVEVNGKLVVAAQTENFSSGIKNCEDYVVGFFAGKRLSFSAVQLAVGKIWKLKNEVSIKLYGDCAFIFKFADDEDRMKVLETGSFYIAKSLFTLRPWTQLIEKSISDIKSVPIWVLIYGVPLHMWNNEGLSLISSYLGKPILADDCTVKQTRLSYARICVEIDFEFSYPSSIPLLIDGKIAFDLPVEYQWKPFKCENCMVFGHSVKNCPRKTKTKTRWTPKKDGISQLKFTTEAVNREDEVSIQEISIEVDEELENISTPMDVGDDTNRDSGGRSGDGGLGVVNKDSNNKFMVLATLSSLDNEGNGGIAYTTTHMPEDNGNKTSGSSGAMETNENARRQHIGISGRVATQSATATCGFGDKNCSNGAVIVNTAIGLGVKKAFVHTTSQRKSPTKPVAKTSTNGNGAGTDKSEDASQGDWIAVKGKKNNTGKQISPPKRNPFMVYSDFEEDSRFPINKTKEMEARKVTSIASRVVVDRVTIPERVSLEEREDTEDLVDSEIEFEKNLQYLSIEDKIAKRQEREMYRLHWSGKGGSSSKGGISSQENQTLGRGQRSQAKKRNS